MKSFEKTENKLFSTSCPFLKIHCFVQIWDTLLRIGGIVRNFPNSFFFVESGKFFNISQVSSLEDVKTHELIFLIRFLSKIETLVQ